MNRNKILAIVAGLMVVMAACFPAKATTVAQPTAAPAATAAPGQPAPQPTSPTDPAPSTPGKPAPDPAGTTPPPATGGYADCPPAQEVWEELGGLEVIAIGIPNGKPDKDDRCVFNWNSNSSDSTRPVTKPCPAGWMCTVNIKGDPITQVHVGPSQVSLTAGTFRLITYKGRAIYDQQNPLSNPCLLVENENQYFRDQKQDRLGWRAVTVGFNCPGIQPVPQQGSAAPAPAKPTNANGQAKPQTTGGNPQCTQVNQSWLAQNIGGQPNLWEAKNPGDWEYMGKGRGRVDFKYPGFGTLDSWQGRDVSKGAGTPKGTLVASNDQATWHSGCR